MALEDDTKKMAKAARLKLARKYRLDRPGHKSTATEGAAHAGVKKDTYFQHENGTREIEDGPALIYASKFNVPAEWILLGLNPPEFARDHNRENRNSGDYTGIEQPLKMVKVNPIGRVDGKFTTIGEQQVQPKMIDAGVLPRGLTLFELEITTDILNTGFPKGTVIGIYAKDRRPQTGQSVAVRIVKGDEERFVIRTVVMQADETNTFFTIGDDEKLSPHKFADGELYEIVGKILEYRLIPDQPAGDAVRDLIALSNLPNQVNAA